MRGDLYFAHSLGNAACGLTPWYCASVNCLTSLDDDDDVRAGVGGYIAMGYCSTDGGTAILGGHDTGANKPPPYGCIPVELTDRNTLVIDARMSCGVCACAARKLTWLPLCICSACRWVKRLSPILSIALGSDCSAGNTFSRVLSGCDVTAQIECWLMLWLLCPWLDNVSFVNTLLGNLRPTTVLLNLFPVELCWLADL